MSKTLVHIHDPMCSWCWGFRPVWEQVLRGLDTKIQQGDVGVYYLVGGLAPDSDAPMPMDMQHMLKQTWQRIQTTIPGTPFNFDFWEHSKPRRSTYPACRAVLAAKHMSAPSEIAMIKAIQKAYYLEAKNPSDHSTLEAVATSIGLEKEAFTKALVSDNIEQQLQQQIALSRYLFQSMESRGFPSLALIDGDTVDTALTAQQIITIDIDYNHSQPMLAISVPE